MGWFDSKSGYKQSAVAQQAKQQLPIVKVRGVPMAFDKSTGNYWLGNTPLNTNDGSMSMWLKDQAGSTDYYNVDNSKPSVAKIKPRSKSAVINRVKNNPAQAISDLKQVFATTPVMAQTAQQEVMPVSQQPQNDGGLLSALAGYFKKTPEQEMADRARMDAMVKSWEHGAVGDTSLLFQ